MPRKSHALGPGSLAHKGNCVLKVSLTVCGQKGSFPLLYPAVMDLNVVDQNQLRP